LDDLAREREASVFLRAAFDMEAAVLGVDSKAAAGSLEILLVAYRGLALRDELQQEDLANGMVILDHLYRLAFERETLSAETPRSDLIWLATTSQHMLAAAGPAGADVARLLIIRASAISGLLGLDALPARHGDELGVTAQVQRAYATGVSARGRFCPQSEDQIPKDVLAIWLDGIAPKPDLTALFPPRRQRSQNSSRRRTWFSNRWRNCSSG
jgi:hypothetical protein